MTREGIDTGGVFPRNDSERISEAGKVCPHTVPVGLMKATVLLLAALLCASAGIAQGRAEAGLDKQVLDRLESLTVLVQSEWRYHADIPHPEDSELSDADWPTVKTREGWKSGARVLRRWIEIPEKINGYTTRGAKVSLELYFSEAKYKGHPQAANGATLP